MDNWRIIGQGDFIKGIELREVKFPDFWKRAYLTKNDFYQMIVKDATNFVKKYKRGTEFLDGEKVQEFWHAHCDFCTEKISTEDSRVCYRNQDYSIWICKKCFDDFNEKFDFKLIKK